MVFDAYDEFSAYDSAESGELNWDSGDDGEVDYLASVAAGSTKKSATSVCTGALVANAAKTLKKKTQTKAVAPLTKASTVIAKVLSKKKQTKPAVVIAAPVIKSAVKDIKKLEKKGSPVTPKKVVRIVQKNLKKAAANEKTAAAVMQKSAAKGETFKRKTLNKSAIKNAEKFS